MKHHDLRRAVVSAAAIALLLVGFAPANADSDRSGAERVEDSCFATSTGDAAKPSMTFVALAMEPHTKKEINTAYEQCASVITSRPGNPTDMLHLGLVEYLKQGDTGSKDWRATAFYHFKESVSLAYSMNDAFLVQQGCEVANGLAKDGEFSCPEDFMQKISLRVQKELRNKSSDDRAQALSDEVHLRKVISTFAALT